MDPKYTETTKTAAGGQVEMTIDESTIYIVSEEFVQAKEAVARAKDAFEKAEHKWVDEMKTVKKTKINHRGNVIQVVRGKTSEDHARFAKA